MDQQGIASLEGKPLTGDLRQKALAWEVAYNALAALNLPRLDNGSGIEQALHWIETLAKSHAMIATLNKT